ANVLSRYIRSEGCEVRTAGSAEEAIALTGRESFDLILLDLVLPGITGFGAIEALKRQGDAPIIIMTGYGEEDVRSDAESLGVSGVIGKPVEFQKLLDIIRGLRHGCAPQLLST
ncbi:MAG: response regulator, partial [bacterium]